MAFARTMSDYSIDKDDFWQLADGAQQPGDEHPPLHRSSDFLDQFVMMEMDGAEHMSAHSPVDSVSFLPHSHSHSLDLDLDLDLDFHHAEAVAGLSSSSSPPASASSAAGPISMTSREDDSVEVDLLSQERTGSRSRSTKAPSSSLASPQRQSQTAARQEAADRSRPGPGPTNHVVLGHLNAETLEQRRRLLSGRRGIDGQAPTAQQAGSISDSELLRLEGLSVHSSPRGLNMGRIVPSASAGVIGGDRGNRGRISSSSSPPLAITTTASSSSFSTTVPHSNQQQRVPITASADDIDLCNLAKSGSRSHNFTKASTRKFESIFSTVRRAVGGRGRIQNSPQRKQQQQQQQHLANTAPLPQTAIASHMESAKKATRRLASESQLMWDGLPISPPLTDMASYHNHHGGDNNAFVAGLTDDPFFDASSVAYNSHEGILGPAARINGKSAAFNANLTIPNTPLATPNLKQEEAGDNANYFPTATTAEPWSINGTSFAPSSTLSNSAPFFSSVDSNGIDAWSFDPTSSDNFTTSSSTQSGSHNPRNHHNLTINLPPYALTAHSPHHTPNPVTDDLAAAGLMIHMPQPRTPSTAPLLSHPMFPDQQSHPLHPFRPAYTSTETHAASRRPKPRAPSSGARYHHQLGLSPRKVRQPSMSSSSTPSPNPGGSSGGRRSRSASRRQASMSFPGPGNGLVVGHRRSTTDLIGGATSDTQSHAIRKRRSTSSWRGSSSRRSGSGDSSSGGAKASGGISFEGVGFVNYTPNDHNVLMTGVAPSGSSKTKMRREKEAAERERKLSEAVLAAGLDVSMLKEEGLVM